MKTIAFTVVLISSFAALSQPQAELREPLEWLYPDSRVGERPAFAETDVPANGVAEANVLLTGLEKGAVVRVAGEGEWFRLVDIPVEHNTGVIGFVENEKKAETNRFVTRRAPFRVYDAMEPLAGGAFVPDGATAALRFRLRRLPGVGTTDLKLRVAQGAFAAELPLRVNVCAARVTSVGRDSFKYTNWMDYWAMATRHGLKPWSEEHWRMIERYAAMAVYARQNMAILRLEDFMSWKDGRLVVDEARLKRLVDIWDAAGAYWLEGGHICNFTGGMWSAKTFDVRLFGKRSTSPEGEAAIRTIATELVRIIDKYGWRDRWVQHVADEPSGHNVTEYRLTCGIVRKHLPGIRLADAVETNEMAGALDAYCPKNRYYQEHRAAFDAFRKAGDEVWCYTCCYPGGEWLNRLLDNELIRPLLLPWGCARFHLDGYLHWGFNRFQRGIDPFRQSITGDWHLGKSLPPGDRNIVYPGKDGPWPSLRLEAQRQGMEDLELLRRLEKKDPKRAEALVLRLVRGFDDYEKDVKAYRAVRKELLLSL